ncbi:TonB-dependent receptor plug [Bacteroides helcogenes P 36-108]|uniref:TonB-dependent receptor plug n=2 Tax=Bacteroides helcogenes TaxID=290053 RepID=E6SVG5_BACT6|nr:TonB-dependent receptor plug [Bacteroides helcogenes P 36-108]
MLTLACLMAAIGWIAAQNSAISGIVISAEDNEPVIGASVSVKGTTAGTVTDVDGKFTITDAPKGATTLHVSFVGMLSQEVAITPGTIRVILKNDAKLLDEVVVTALGITKKEKSLTYSTQVVNGDELIRAKDPNMMNALAGKTAGVQINKSSSGLGGSAKVVIRGNRSVGGSSQPLYVIDGVPYGSSVTETVCTTTGGSSNDPNLDRGDGISNLNPDDIESMNILKGPAAAALYGSSAANGVIIITTKKGKEGRASITFNTSTTLDNATYGIPDFQNDYTGDRLSWGSKLTGGSPDYVKEFFRTGVTTINSLSLSMGTDVMQTYFSYANTYGKGVVDNNSLVKHNLNFRETANFFNKKLTVDANINAVYQKANNRTSTGGYYMNPLVGLYHFPRGGVEGGKDFNYYKDNYEVLDASRNMMTQNWYGGALSEMEQNPYWLINKAPNGDERYRATLNLSVKYKFNDLFSIQARGNADFVADRRFLKEYAGTSAVIAGVNGRYQANESTGLTTYGDILFTYQQQFENFSVNASVGSSINDYYGKGTGFDSGGTGVLYLPNIFTMQNIRLNDGLLNDWQSHTQSQSVFFTGQVGFKDQVFLDVTARNDWTSSLAFTKYKNKGFFYPSIGLTWIMSETLKLPEWIDLGKIRGAWSEVGSGLGSYTSNPLHSVASNGTVSFNTAAPFADLKPERTRSIEFGTEWRFFDSRLEFDFTYYKTNTKDQLFNLPAPSGSEWNTYYVNAGDIQNTGIEIMLGATPVMTKDFRWKTNMNYSHNRNKAKKLVDGLGYFLFGGNDIQNRLEEGGSFGDFYGNSFSRDDEGNIEFDAKGLPIVNKSEIKKLGNPSPDFNLGWGNTLTYKDFSLYFLIDGRFGGDVFSMTQADLDYQGVSKVTGDARNQGYVEFAGHQIKDVEAFYNRVGNRNGCAEYYVYDATNIRLREVSLSYTLPKSLLARQNVIKDAQISLTGRNLFFFKNNAPYDTDGLMSTSNNLQGIDSFGMPTNRSFGINVKLNF